MTNRNIASYSGYYCLCSLNRSLRLLSPLGFTVTAFEISLFQVPEKQYQSFDKVTVNCFQILISNPAGVLIKRCSENTQQIHRRTSMPKCCTLSEHLCSENTQQIYRRTSMPKCCTLSEHLFLRTSLEGCF